MSKKSRLKKENRRLERRLCRLEQRNRKLKKRMKRLARGLEERGRTIASLQRKLERRRSGAADTAPALRAAAGKGSPALQHRNAWQRHAFLRERYEEHQRGGCERQRARELANRDLIGRFGDEAGYTAEQLESILT
ncbi:MAG TPA: hypothetical protein ENI96_14905 [Sedimenticola thiotaurini]|uniref:Uncharacterized protein n=1 Tax=Sedimenticola thiotaurini TaxID=1543721 RepID=A0A831RRC6_9GAMM|nr:hypothetical protein [Sedimenticola thiotaurini]